MLAFLKREYAHLLTSGAQLLLLLVALEFHTLSGWLSTLSLISGISLLAWLSSLHRLRLLRNTPASRIGSAAQGYVELVGSGKLLPESPLQSVLTLRPCLWYRFHIECRSSVDGKWHTEDRGESDTPFVLEDSSGYCVVDPSGAEILTCHKKSWQLDNYRYTEWLLLQAETIFALGQFRTFGGSSMTLDANEEIKNVLAEWKQNMPDLKKRFDLNNDGQLDMQEWMLARQAAKREAAKRMADDRAEPDINYLVNPQDERLFIISNLPQSKIERRYWLWTLAHLAIFFGALYGIAWLLSNTLSNNGYP